MGRAGVQSRGVDASGSVFLRLLRGEHGPEPWLLLRCVSLGAGMTLMSCQLARGGSITELKQPACRHPWPTSLTLFVCIQQDLAAGREVKIVSMYCSCSPGAAFSCRSMPPHGSRSRPPVFQTSPPNSPWLNRLFLRVLELTTRLGLTTTPVVAASTLHCFSRRQSSPFFPCALSSSSCPYASGSS